MTALPSFMYRDPAEVLEGREKCDGCEHLATWTLHEHSVQVCEHGGRAKRKPMARCDHWRHKNQGRQHD